MHYIKLIFTTALLFIGQNFLAQENNTSSTAEKCELEIPNKSTAGTDHLFDVTSNCELAKYELSIFNRWGQSLFTTTDINKKWNTEKIESGVYVWIINYQYPDKEKNKMTGNVTVLH